AESSVERLSFLFLRLKRTPSRKVRVFCCVVYASPGGADKICSTDSGKNIARSPATASLIRQPDALQAGGVRNLQHGYGE
ncbi:hypothetical protein, partial [Klebsiella quasipneumoniae]|uniref:hypothetical protein n=1 Tax=Klebsiella quasipneumoniae TaxID=1463165 RepID=UPI0034DF8F4C